MSGLGDWMRQFTAHTKKAEEASKKTIQAVVSELYTKMVNATPVGNPSLWHPPVVPQGYTPGTLKKAWKFTWNGMQVSNGIIAQIYNDTDYAERIETGWSTQAPAGMMRISVASFGTLVDAKSNTYKLI